MENTTSALETPDVTFFPDLSLTTGTAAACHSRQLCVRHKIICSLWLLCNHEILGFKSWSPAYSRMRFKHLVS